MTLRSDVLHGRRVAIAGDGPGFAVARERLQSLGAELLTLAGDVLADEEGAPAWAQERAPLDAVIVDAGTTFGTGGPQGLRAALEHAWRAVRAVATGALIPSAAPGRLLLIAPGPDAGPHAEAARAALENLARTLSVEWARYRITAVAITPGAGTAAADVAELACFLVSPAGGYFSGCRFDLGSVAPVLS